MVERRNTMKFCICVFVLVYSEIGSFTLNCIFLLYEVLCFIGISDTDKTQNLTCEIIYDNFICEIYRFSNNHHSLLIDILYC